jgi:hypothetical protein
MSNNEKINWFKIKTYIEEVLRLYSNFLSAETVDAVNHYLEHDEFEMAFEGLFLDLMKIERLPPLLDAKECSDLAKKMKLDKESIFDRAFWEKFLSFMESSGK